MNDIQTGELKDLMPPYFTKQYEVIGFSAAIRSGMNLMLKYAKRTMLYSDIDELPEKIIDYLAVENDIQFYGNYKAGETEHTITLAQKRELVKNALKFKMAAGTEHTVEEMCRIVLGEAELVEWYDFEEEAERIPGQFDINADVPLYDYWHEIIGGLIQSAKRASAHLRTIRFLRPMETDTGIGQSMGIYVERSLNNDKNVYLNTLAGAGQNIGTHNDIRI